MRVVFFGSPEAALPSLEALLAAGHDILLAVTQPDRPAGRGRRLAACPVKRLALERGISVLEPERIRRDPETLARLTAAGADIHVVVAYGQIIPLAIIDLPALRTINVHFSLLPKYRGASPVARAILNGEIKTGVTIFRLNARMDEGDILAVAETEIGPEETTGVLERRLAGIGANLLVETLAVIDRLVPVPQDHSKATLAPKLRKEDGRIDWTKDAEGISRLVRAMTPWPTAFTFHRGERLIILKGEAAGPGDPSRPRGTVLAVDKRGLTIACGGGTAYLIADLQREGRKPTSGHAFSLGGKIKEGEILG
jgi:methionyl-tRNA formyltransferase